jgi:hypothetical protein
MFKALVASLFLDKEVRAIKIRLSEASNALKRIEAAAVNIPKESSPEVHKLASDVLTHVLGSADQVRTKQANFHHEWEAKAYDMYHSCLAGPLSPRVYAGMLIEKTKVFFGN